MGITDNGSYKAMNQVPHGYAVMRGCARHDPLLNCRSYTSTVVASVGPILDDPGDVPYDKYTVYWQNYQ